MKLRQNTVGDRDGNGHEDAKEAGGGSNANTKETKDTEGIVDGNGKGTGVGSNTGQQNTDAKETETT